MPPSRPCVPLASPLRAMVVACMGLAMSGCGSAPDSQGSDGGHPYDLDPQLVFWAELQELCGKAFEGTVVDDVPRDEAIEGARLIMHVYACDLAETRISFSVGADRSRTWVVTPTAAGLHLEHEHRHEDGTEDAVTGYGGDTLGPGTEARQDFYADAYTASLVPAAASNVWTVEVHPDSLFAYALRREGSERRFRVEFDLSRPIGSPLAPWGG